MGFFAGIDIGSLSTEAVILDNDEKEMAYSIEATGANCTDAAEQAIEKAVSSASIGRKDLDFIVATGYGRITIPFAQKRVTEISCHAVGAHHLFPDTGTVIDIGGQDSKVIRIDKKGKVLDFAMNDKCAAGTGRFLEVMAGTFQVPIQELGPLSLKAKNSIPISSVCTVFAESEVISLIAQDRPREEIIRGLHTSVVNRIWSMVKTVGVQGRVTLSGGVAKNEAVVKLLEEHLGEKVHVHKEPQIVGALGAAILARRQFMK